MKTVQDFYNAGNYKRVRISDHVEFGGALGHVVAVGRVYMTVLFYKIPEGYRTGRIKLSPFSPGVVFPGTQHN